MFAYPATAIWATPANGSQPEWHVADGSYVSWTWNFRAGWLTPANVSWVSSVLNTSQTLTSSFLCGYGPIVVYNRAILDFVMANYPNGNVGEWLDEQMGLLSKFGVSLSNWMLADDDAAWNALQSRDGLILHVPYGVSAAYIAGVQRIAATGAPIVIIGNPHVIDASLLELAGLNSSQFDPLPAGMYNTLLATCNVQPCGGIMHYGGGTTPRVTSAHVFASLNGSSGSLPVATVGGPSNNVMWWLPTDWVDPSSPDVSVSNLGLTVVHAAVALWIQKLQLATNVSTVQAGVTLSEPLAVNFFNTSSAGVVVLAVNAETANAGGGQPAVPVTPNTPRSATLYLNFDHLGIPHAHNNISLCWSLGLLAGGGVPTRLPGIVAADGASATFHLSLAAGGGAAYNLQQVCA